MQEAAAGIVIDEEPASEDVEVLPDEHEAALGRIETDTDTETHTETDTEAEAEAAPKARSRKKS